ncbi:unnamed protein product [Rotaria socialis]
MLAMLFFHMFTVWSRHSDTAQGEILIDNIWCWGLALDERRYLYVSDVEKGEVRRYQLGEKNGTLVAGGNGLEFKNSSVNSYRHSWNILD